MEMLAVLKVKMQALIKKSSCGYPGLWEENMGGFSQRVASFSYTRWIGPRGLLYNMEPLVNTVLYT